MKKLGIRPSQPFLKELEMMELNEDYDEVCIRIAHWCKQMSKTSVVVKENAKWTHEVSPSEYAQNVFSMYHAIFSAMKKCHSENGNPAFGELRDKVRKTMEEDMVLFLGDECYKAFDEHFLIS